MLDRYETIKLLETLQLAVETIMLYTNAILYSDSRIQIVYIGLYKLCWRWSCIIV